MPRFAETTKLLDRDLSKVSADQAVKNIDMWEESLNGLDSKGGKAVAKDLEALKTALTKDKPSGPAIAKLLTRLGDATTKLADEAPEAQQDKLREIGKALTEAGAGDGADD
jgi:hypothetical protein